MDREWRESMTGEAPTDDAVTLSRFSQLNAEAGVKDTHDAFEVSSPWGDDSVVFRVSHEARAVADALNMLRFPPRFSAVWHMDTQDLEFIFGTISVKDEMRNRSFTFEFGGKSLLCEFASASERLVHVANAARPTKPSPTEQRNLGAIRPFARLRATLETRGEEPMLVLASFWIRKCDVPESELPNLARHLNFYMRYFDRASPIIVMHEEPVSRQVGRSTRFLYGAFPSRISARVLDSYMLTLWDSGLPSSGPVRSFLYNYQILEYAAFYYLKEELARSIRRIVSSPDIVVRAEEASHRILDALVDERTPEEAKITSVVQQAVDPAALWAEIALNEAFFSEPTEFEGGFVLPALIKKGWAIEDFRAAWIPKLPDSFRKLRNALLHAREQRLSKCIAPTACNSVLLRPWSLLISIASSQIILFGDS
jgi:hypothetical protein